MNYPGGRSGQVAERLLGDIVAGKYPPGARLPTEPELCEAMGVSRATVREAMKSLQQRGVTSIEQGRGTFVNPRDRWSPLDPMLLAARTGGSTGEIDPAWAVRLTEARRVVEVGVAAIAASRRSDADLEQMRASITAMEAAGDDVTTFAAADLAFHEAVLQAADNELIQALLDPVHRLVEEVRVLTSRAPVLRSAAIEAHTAILSAIEAGDGDAAGRAMRDHLDDTLGWVAAHPGPETSDTEGAAS